MKDKKRELNWYQADDGEALARHLEKMAAKGWLLESVDSTWRTFRREEPSQVKYAITYFPDASVFDSRPTGGQETYADYCAAAGWEFVAAYGPIQYFRSTRPDPVPIETDEGEKLRAIHRSMLKTLVLGHGLLLVSVGITTWSHLKSFGYSPLSSVSKNINVGLDLLLAVLLVYLLAILADYFVWYLRSKISVARGGACVKVHTRARMAGGWVLIAALVLSLLGTLTEAANPGMVPIIIFCFGAVTVLIVGIQAGLKLFKKWGFSREKTRWAYIALCVGMGVLYSAGLIGMAMFTVGTGGMERKPVEAYTNSYGWKADRYEDELPVTLEDLGFTVPEEAHCSYEADVSRSVLASYGVFDQDALEIGSDLPIWTCQVAVIKWDWLRRLCWDTLLEQYDRYDEYDYELSGPHWGAEETLRRDGGRQDFLLLYSDRIIRVQAGWELSEEQAALVTERLLAWD